MRRAIIGMHAGVILDPSVGAGRYEIRFMDAGCDTAFWSYVRNRGRWVHLMVFGSGLVKRCVHRSAARIAAYAENYYQHEFQHSLSTTPKLTEFRAHARAFGVPFKLCGMAEDARIEELARKRRQVNFRWLDFETAHSVQNHYDALFALVQAEGDVARVVTSSVWIDSDTVYAVVEFYRQMVTAAETWDLVPICSEFVKQFGLPPDEWGSNEFGTGADLRCDPARVAGFLSHPTGGGQSSQCDPGVAGDADFFVGADKAAPLDEILIEKCSAALSKAFPSPDGFEAVAAPGRRMRKTALGRSTVLRYERLHRGGDGRRPTVQIYYDCSQSMSQGDKRSPHTYGKALLCAVNQMAKQGHIGGEIVLTGGFRDQSRFVRIPLPCPPQLIGRIRAQAEFEGIDAAMRATAAKARAADVVLCYTDGRINDDPIDSKFWRSRGVFSTGIYVGSDCSAAMMRWFDSVICRPSAVELALAIAGKLRR